MQKFLPHHELYTQCSRTKSLTFHFSVLGSVALVKLTIQDLLRLFFGVLRLHLFNHMNRGHIAVVTSVSLCRKDLVACVIKWTFMVNK